MNKFISSLSAIALLAVIVIGPVSAAGIAVDSAVYADGVGNGTITVTDAGKDYTADNIATWRVISGVGGAVANGTSAEVVEASGSFVITAAALDALVADTYALSFSTVAGDFTAVIVVVGNDNQVSVSATVDPILTFALDANTLALGTLPTAADAYANDSGTTKINPTVSANAEGGIVVTMASTGLKSSTKEIGVTDIAGGVAPTTGTDYYKVSTNASPNITDANAGLSAAGGTDMLASQTVYSVSTPVSGGTVAVTVAARAAATTEAGNYSDTLTFTATPTF